MNHTLYAFLLTTIAGLFTMVGAIVICFKHKNAKHIIISSLSFAAGVMITVSIIDLIPESYHSLTTTFYIIPTILLIIIFIVVGILISIGIDKYLPTEQAYHHNSLYRVGVFSMIAIILHNLPEGIATFMATTTNIKLGITMSVAIALHNLPEGISIAIPIYYATKSHKKAFFYTLLSALSEPIGALLTLFFLRNYINDMILGFLFAIIAGIMFHISFSELLPSSIRYNDKARTYGWFFIGILLMLFSHFIFL